MSGRDAKVITYHSQFGEVGRTTISYEMLSGDVAGASESKCWTDH
jgi:hypothetical protein